jgi:hypothetical protein
MARKWRTCGALGDRRTREVCKGITTSSKASSRPCWTKRWTLCAAVVIFEPAGEHATTRERSSVKFDVEEARRRLAVFCAIFGKCARCDLGFIGGIRSGRDHPQLP